MDDKDKNNNYYFDIKSRAVAIKFVLEMFEETNEYENLSSSSKTYIDSAKLASKQIIEFLSESGGDIQPPQK